MSRKYFLLLLSNIALLFLYYILSDSNLFVQSDLALKTDLNRIFIGVITSPQTYKRRFAVENTWKKHLEGMYGAGHVRFFIGQSESNDSSPQPITSPIDDLNLLKDPSQIVTLNVPEKSSHTVTEKTIAAWKWMYDNILDDYDWFMKCDDDAFVFPENLLDQLEKYNPNESIYLGRSIQSGPRHLNSGGAGYLFSRKLLQDFGPLLTKCWDLSSEKTGEDVVISDCLKRLPQTQRMHNNAFYPVFPDTENYKEWKRWDSTKNLQFKSKPAVIHYVDYEAMFLFDFLVFSK